MHVALYLRRSTVDLQPDSLEAQEEILRNYAAANGHEVVQTFKDSASGRSVTHRDAFRELIELIRHKPGFEAILVRDVSRWSRAENTDEAGFYEFVCRSHGVQVIYVEETFGPESSPYGLLLKSIKRAMAAEFSRERSRMVVGSALRVVRQGYWPSGSVPFGLRRALVDRDGRTLRLLAPGEQKAVSGQRVRLAPGDPREIALVRRIFGLYADTGMSSGRIADLLRSEGTRGPRGGTWSAGMVSQTIRNEAYVGTVVYRARRGRTRSELRSLAASENEWTARCPNAHEAIIPAEQWEKAQARLRENSRRLSDADLIGQLAGARRLWHGAAAPGKEVITARDLRDGDALTDWATIAEEVPPAVETLRREIEGHFQIDDFDGGWLVDHLIHVGFKVSLPHARLGGLHWRFEFSGKEPEDVVVGLGFSPPPLIRHVETFVFRHVSSWRKTCSSPPLLGTGRVGKALRVGAIDDLVAALRTRLRYRSTRAEKRFREAIQGEATLNLGEIGEHLGWPATDVRRIYRKLELRGEDLPPLGNHAQGRRVRMTCPHCLRVRRLRPEIAVTLDTDVCFECLHRPPLRRENRLVAICPRCGTRRLMRPSEVRKRSAGLSTPCRSCSMAEARLRRHAGTQAQGRAEA